MNKRTKDTCRYCGSNPRKNCTGHLGGGCEYPKYERVLVTKTKLKPTGLPNFASYEELLTARKEQREITIERCAQVAEECFSVFDKNRDRIAAAIRKLNSSPLGERGHQEATENTCPSSSDDAVRLANS